VVAGAGVLGKADEVPKRQWTLRILGGFSLTDQEGAEAPSLGKLDRALLTYLVLSGQQRHARAKLEELLWPGRTTSDRSLTVSLHTLRRALGDKDGDIIAMKSDPQICHFENIDVDALALERLVKQGTPEALAEAEALYAGDLLEGLDVRSDDFDRWLVPERTRLQGVIIDGLRRLMRHREQSGQLEKAMETARRILQLDDLTEDAHRTIIATLLRTGQRAAARKHAQYCEDLLKEEGIPPEPETRRAIASARGAGDPVEDRASQMPPAEPSVRPGEPAVGAVPATGQLAKDIWDGREPPVAREPQATEPAEPHAATSEAPPTPEKPTPGRILQHIRLLLIAIVALLLAVLAVMVGAFWNDPALAPAPLDRIVAWIQGRPSAPKVPAERPSIAVLPFERLGDDDAGDYADSVSGDVAEILRQVSEIASVPRTSVLALSDRRLPPAEIAQALRVRYVLEGRLKKEESHVEVTITLIDTSDSDRAILTKMYDADGRDAIALGKQIAREVITELEILLTSGEQERIDSEHRTQNVEAWLAASRGENLIRQLDPAAIRMARKEYEIATGLDDQYAGAWEGLAWTYYIERRFGWGADSADALRKADEFGQKALDLDPERARTYSLLGSIRLLQGRFDEAIRLGKEAVDREPNDADSAALLAHTYTYVGQPRDAIVSIERAIELRRVAPRWYSWVRGRALRLSGDHKQAAAMLEDAIGPSPDSYLPLVELAATLEEMGDSAKAGIRATQIKWLTLVMNKQFSSSGWVNLVPYKDPATAARDIAALRKAGLPD
jgi:DNA-binding SARP family transcriptional activator/TolB-like protein/cytochrome c-type biogenesis protein CcmH/NrfG